MTKPLTKLSPDVLNRVYEKLAKEYPDTRTELIHKNPYELIIAVILSAQCTDARVNLVTPELFKRFPSPEKLASAEPAVIEKIIHSCGFYRAKTKSIQSAARDLAERFHGAVPRRMEELITLAGVGRKTASVVLNQGFDIPAIAVDTHVKRVSYRLGWTHHTNPEKIEKDLCTILPPEKWGAVNGMLILHGRRICKARKPLCEKCIVKEDCKFYRNHPA